MKKLMTAAIAATLMLAVPTTSFAYYCPPAKTFTGGSSNSAAPWIVIGCAGGVVLAALAANYRDNRELTAEEAWSCGALFLVSTPHHKKHKKHKHHN